MKKRTLRLTTIWVLISFVGSLLAPVVEAATAQSPKTRAPSVISTTAMRRRNPKIRPLLLLTPGDYNPPPDSRRVVPAPHAAPDAREGSTPR